MMRLPLALWMPSPKGFHRIRHYGLFASTCRAENIARARELLATAAPTIETAPDNAEAEKFPAVQQAFGAPCDMVWAAAQEGRSGPSRFRTRSAPNSRG